MPLSRVFTPPDTDADPTGDCDRACAVRAFVEHGIYRRPLRHMPYIEPLTFLAVRMGFAAVIMAIIALCVACCGDFAQCMSPLLAQSGHQDRATECPLLGVKRTSRFLDRMSTSDPSRQSDTRFCCDA
jgi:hypothetical protein